jgi:hypothetical protein
MVRRAHSSCAPNRIRIRIQEAQKHVDPDLDPNLDPDPSPEHGFKYRI